MQCRRRIILRRRRDVAIVAWHFLRWFGLRRSARARRSGHRGHPPLAQRSSAHLQRTELGLRDACPEIPDGGRSDCSPWATHRHRKDHARSQENWIRRALRSRVFPKASLEPRQPPLVAGLLGINSFDNYAGWFLFSGRVRRDGRRGSRSRAPHLRSPRTVHPSTIEVIGIYASEARGSEPPCGHCLGNVTRRIKPIFPEYAVNLSFSSSQPAQSRIVSNDAPYSREPLTSELGSKMRSAQ